MENIGDIIYYPVTDWYVNSSCGFIFNRIGTTGSSKRLEGIILMLPPGILPNCLDIEYMGHFEDLGDLLWVKSGEFLGTRGEARRMEGVAIRLLGKWSQRFDVFYQAYLQGTGQTEIFRNGDFCGTRGQCRRLEALKVWIESKKS